MKNILQGIGFVIIVIGGFWVGMQWGAMDNNLPKNDYEHIDKLPPLPPLPAPVSPEPVSGEVGSPVTPTLPIEEKEPVDLPTPKNDKVIHYESNYFKYGFDMPANVYYSAFGGAEGAQHTVGIAKEIPETLSDGAVRVYFYGKKILPELQNATNNTYKDPAGKYIYLLLNGQYSVKIEANDISNPIVQKIVQTIAVSQ